MSDFMRGCNIHIIPLGLGRRRLLLFECQIKKHGGTVTDQLNNKTFPTVTHIAVERESINIIVKELNEEFQDFSNIKLVKIEWISECLKAKSKVDDSLYEIPIVASARKRHHEEEPSTSKSAKKSLNTSDFVCAHASANPTLQQETIPNKDIINEFEKLAAAFKNSGDQWRNFGYTKAIAAIKSYGKPITSYEEARAIPGLGDKMASKVWEMLETGALRRTQEVCEGERAETLKLFMGVWGAGTATTQQWYSLGYRTLDDLRNKATLTNQQKIGLQYYDEIQEKIPRDEVSEIVKVVENEALNIQPGLDIHACGSYRRGKPTCGDIDILMCHPTVDVTRTLLPPLVDKLRSIGFITENLTAVDESHRKFFGMCRLPGGKHRRLDLFTVPWGERGPALLHYTGSALFNRSIRLLAQKKDMSLTEHALYGVAIRQGRDKVATGNALFTPTEESVFKHLEIPYRPPEERDH